MKKSDIKITLEAEILKFIKRHNLNSNDVIKLAEKEIESLIDTIKEEDKELIDKGLSWNLFGDGYECTWELAKSSDSNTKYDFRIVNIKIVDMDRYKDIWGRRYGKVFKFAKGKELKDMFGKDVYPLVYRLKSETIIDGESIVTVWLNRQNDTISFPKAQLLDHFLEMNKYLIYCSEIEWKFVQIILQLLEDPKYREIVLKMTIEDWKKVIERLPKKKDKNG